MMTVWSVESKHRGLRGEYDPSHPYAAVEPPEERGWRNNNKRHHHKHKRHGNKHLNNNYSRENYYGQPLPPQQYYYGPDQYARPPYDNYYGQQQAPPPQYYYDREQYEYDRYYEQYYQDNYCRDCKEACYGFECSLTCCQWIRPTPRDACHDCNTPCYGDECMLECCDETDGDDAHDSQNENDEATCNTCEDNNPCTVDSVDIGNTFHSHCQQDRFIKCDENSECYELPMSLWDLLVSDRESIKQLHD